MLNLIDRLGVYAVLGRPLGAGEIRRMMTVENIVRWTTLRSKHLNWATWEGENPGAAAVINHAALLADDMGYLDD